MMMFLTLAAMTAAIGSDSPPKADAQTHCQQVRARYAIYADGDVLWVVGSKHRLSVVIDALDHELQARGWENAVAYGDFTICTDQKAPPRSLTIRDRVTVSGYRNVTFVRP